MEDRSKAGPSDGLSANLGASVWEGSNLLEALLMTSGISLGFAIGWFLRGRPGSHCFVPKIFGSLATVSKYVALHGHVGSIRSSVVVQTKYLRPASATAIQ